MKNYKAQRTTIDIVERQYLRDNARKFPNILKSKNLLNLGIRENLK